MKIIAFAGLAQAGKTTAAQAAAKAAFELGFSPKFERFAGPLKDASNTIGFRKGGETDDLYREWCQVTGSMARNTSPDWWVNLMTERLDALAAEEASSIDDGPFHEYIVFIDDVRYMNELELVRKYSGQTVFVSAMRRLDMSDEFRTHVSEQLATEYESGRHPDETFDYTISNNEPDTLENFEAVVEGFAARLIGSVRGEK